MAKAITPELEREQLAAAVAYALDEWTQVEITLTFIFCSVFDDTTEPLPSGWTAWQDLSPRQRMLHAIMDAIVAFDARLDVVQAVINEGGLPDLLVATWQKLDAKLRKKYKSRHQVAHFLILDLSAEKGKTRYKVAPFATATEGPNETRLGISEINAKQQHFHEMRQALLWFGRQVEICRGRVSGPEWPVPALIERIVQGLKSQTPEAQS